MNQHDIIYKIAEYLTSNQLMIISRVCKLYAALFKDLREFKSKIRDQSILLLEPEYYMSLRYNQLYYQVKQNDYRYNYIILDISEAIPIYENIHQFYLHYSALLDSREIDGIPGIENLVVWHLKHRKVAGLKKSVGWACGMGHIKVFNILLDMGFEINETDRLWAAQNKQETILDYIDARLSSTNM